MANTKAKTATPANATEAAPLVAITVQAAPANATDAAAMPAGQLKKYAALVATYGLGYMVNGARMFTVGAWPKSNRLPAMPANLADTGALAMCNVQQAAHIGALQAGATATKAVSGQAIALAMVTPGTPANTALLATAAARRVIRGAQYAAGGKACGAWFSGYMAGKGGGFIAPNGSLTPA